MEKFLIGLLVAIAILASVAYFSDIEGSKREKKVSLTEEQFMIIYWNGYVSGARNMQINNEVNLYTWKLDSIQISDRFFK